MNKLLLADLAEIQRTAHMCPECQGEGEFDGGSVEEANNEHGYELIEGEWTCYKCGGTGEVSNPDVDKLIDTIKILVEAVEARQELDQLDDNTPKTQIPAWKKYRIYQNHAINLIQNGLRCLPQVTQDA